MATIYFYIDSSKLDKVKKFGLKLSDNYSHTIPIGGLAKRVFVGLLNPKDDLSKYNSKDYTCLKVNLYPEQCYILNEVSLIITPKDGDYKLIPLNDYIYGSLENPRVVFNSSILPEQIEVLNDIIDEPILFENSKDLFYRIRIEKIIDELDPSEVYFALCEYLDYEDGKGLSNLGNH
jgi:hypothetical protein